jgi:hypothetical protein
MGGPKMLSFGTYKLAYYKMLERTSGSDRLFRKTEQWKLDTIQFRILYLSSAT